MLRHFIASICIVFSQLNTTLYGEYVQIYVCFLTYKPGNKQGNYGFTFQDRNFLLQAFESPEYKEISCLGALAFQYFL